MRQIYYKMMNNTLIQANDTLENATQCFDAMCNIANGISDVANTWADLQRDMHQMDLQFAAYMGNLDVNLEKYRISAPVVSKQLDGLQNIMNKILDKVLEMDATNDIQMQNKMRLMDSVDGYVDKLATMMIKLL